MTEVLLYLLRPFFLEGILPSQSPCSLMPICRVRPESSGSVSRRESPSMLFALN